MIEIKSTLEMDITHACNLHCPNCAHYSNYNLSGNVTLADAEAWLGAWSQRVKPNSFYLMGGEPALNPDAPGIVRLVRRIWPEIKVVLVSNGLLLHRHDDLLAALQETGTQLEISYHSNHDERYLERMSAALDALQAQVLARGIKLVIREDKYLHFKTYRGEGSSMKPFQDGDPAKSWHTCVNQVGVCLTIYKGRMWKCPPAAMLDLVAEKFKFDKDPDWLPYLSYEGIAADAPEDELQEFFTHLYQPEYICAMCPTKLVHEVLLDVTSPFVEGQKRTVIASQE